MRERLYEVTVWAKSREDARPLWKSLVHGFSSLHAVALVIANLQRFDEKRQCAAIDVQEVNKEQDDE